MTVIHPEPYTLPIPSRQPKSWAQSLNALLASLTFLVGCLMINGSQLIFLTPLLFLPDSGDLYDMGVRYTKGAFGNLLLLMSQWFAPTKIVITFETSGKGKLSQHEIDDIVRRDGAGNVVALRLPTKSVVMSNHQVYADWWYLWSLTYFMGTHKDVFIVLKKSLKWVPILGWGMQFFNFVFLDRSWASDRTHLVTQLADLAGQAEKRDKPLTLIVYPEGTLVSDKTRPISKKYADKMGIEDLKHILLPRSTGLLYSLRTLAPRMPTLRLIDLTMVYPGIPPRGYGQSYYTLRSIFFDRVPPPAIHVHLRMFDVASGEVPIGGDLNNSEVPENERSQFDLWLQELWQDKDQLISDFHETGTFVKSSEKTSPANVAAVIPLELQQKRDILSAFCFGGPALVGYVWSKVMSRS